MSVCKARKAEVLLHLASDVARVTSEHEARKSTLWVPHELLVGNEDRAQCLEAIAEEAKSLSAAEWAVFCLNLLTEEGLPSFHRLLATYLGEEPHWVGWTDRWTAEEKRHGDVMEAYLQYANPALVDIAKLEHLKFQYLRRGFRPAWSGDPYQLLAYTCLQEDATQVSHRNEMKLVGDDAPILGGILGRISGEEGYHKYAYRVVFGRVMDEDPEQAVVSLQTVALNFAMPGGSVPHFSRLALIAARLGVFNLAQYGTILENALAHFKVAALALKTPEANAARDAMFKYVEKCCSSTELSSERKAKVRLPFLREMAEA